MKIRENVLISSLTTIKLGALARYVIEITDARDVRKAYHFAFEKNLPVWVMGAGANTIGTDQPFPGVVIINKLRGIELEREVAGQLMLKGMGGEKWDDFVAFACRRGYSGIECLSGIPGTLGAAPVQNIGAYGQEISQTLAEVFAYDSKKNRAFRIPVSSMDLKYRQSIFNSQEQQNRYFIISVTVNLHRAPQLQPPFYRSLQTYIDEHGVTDFSPENIRRIVLAIRKAKLPNPAVEPSAGSFFKNIVITDEEFAVAQEKGHQVYEKPDGTKLVNSGWLIEASGLKGYASHGFHVSDKAALVLINDSATSYADLAAIRSEIVDKVQAEFGYQLQQEPVEVGVTPYFNNL